MISVVESDARNLPSKTKTVSMKDAFSTIANGMNVRQDREGTGLPISRIETISNGRVDLTKCGYAGVVEAGVEKWLLREGEILFSHINSPEQVGKCAIVEAEHLPLIHGMNLLRLVPRPDVLDSRFALYYLRSGEFRSQLRRFINQAVNQASVSISNLKPLELRLPSLSDQRRIAAILDKVDELGMKRRQSLANLDVLTHGIFDAVFGDLTEWPKVTLNELCRGDFRNGVSPSTRGSIRQRVLTLSAVTGKDFDAGASRIGMFDRPTPVEQRVASSSLLICRGNGNLNLVGRGLFPPMDYADVVFPDTIIAAKPDFSRVTRAFLEYVWNSSDIRSQLENRARTTNGTFKVNQSMLGEILLPEPPMSLQNVFSKQVAVVDQLRESYRRHLDELSILFGSLQYRLYRGQLDDQSLRYADGDTAGREAM